MKDKHDFKNKIEQSTQEDETPQNLSAEISSFSCVLIIINGWVCSSTCTADVGR